MDAAVYLRISEDRSGEQLGVSRQRQDCVKLCAEKGWTPIEYIDNDISATSGKKRPAYERMLADIADGRISAVVVWDLDRLHRRPIELEGFMALADQKHLALASVSGDVNLSTPQGRLVARLKGSVAAHEGEQRKARQLAATRQLADNGVPNWHRAFGYDANLQPDPVTAPLVRQAYTAVLAGSSLADICKLFNDAGALTVTGKTWSPTVVSKFLRKARNAGLRTYGHLYGPVTREHVVGKGDWPALVDESTFWAAQAVLDAPGRAPGRKSVRKHLLTGVLACGKCEGHLSGAYVDGGRLTYLCKKCHGVSIRAELVEPLLYDIICERLTRPDAVDLLKDEMLDEAEAEDIRLELIELNQAKMDIGVERGKRLLTGEQAKIATDLIDADIAKLERRQQDQERLRVFDGIPLGTPEADPAIRALSPDRLRAVIAVLMAPSVEPVGKSGRVFRDERLKPNWRA